VNLTIRIPIEGRKSQNDYERNRLAICTHFLFAKEAGEQTGHGGTYAVEDGEE
jgi:hypothetical protein